MEIGSISRNKINLLLVSLACVLYIDYVVAGEDRTLMVGNSFSTGIYGVLPQSATVGLAATGGWTLIDHANSSATKNAICNNAVDNVLLQNYSSSPATASTFHQGIDAMVNIVQDCGKKPMLFITWRTIWIDYNTISREYRAAARKHNIPIMDIGGVFEFIRDHDRGLFQALRQDDGKHLTRNGDAAAAMATAYFLGIINEDGFNDVEHSFTANQFALVTQAINERITPLRAKGVAALPAIIQMLLLNN